MSPVLTSPDVEPVSKTEQPFTAPHPGSQAMPRWNTGELIDTPRVGWRNMLAMIGPGALHLFRYRLIAVGVAAGLGRDRHRHRRRRLVVQGAGGF